MSKSTFNILRFLWVWYQRTKKDFASYAEFHTHFQSVEVNFLSQLGYLVRLSDGVKITEKTKELTSEKLYSIYCF